MALIILRERFSSTRGFPLINVFQSICALLRCPFGICRFTMTTFGDTLASCPGGRSFRHRGPYPPSEPRCLGGSLAEQEDVLPPYLICIRISRYPRLDLEHSPEAISLGKYLLRQVLHTNLKLYVLCSRDKKTRWNKVEQVNRYILPRFVRFSSNKLSLREIDFHLGDANRTNRSLGCLVFRCGSVLHDREAQRFPAGLVWLTCSSTDIF